MTVYNVIGDAYIVKQSPTENTGSSTLLKLHKAPSEDNYFDTLMRFATMPHGEVVESAILHYYQNNLIANTYTGYKCTQDWDESTVTWNSKPTYENDPPWSTFTMLFSEMSAGWKSAGITNIVKRWVEDEDPQYGIIILGITATWSYATSEIRSKEHSGGSYKPYIEVLFAGVGGKAVIFGQVG